MIYLTLYDIGIAYSAPVGRVERIDSLLLCQFQEEPAPIFKFLPIASRPSHNRLINPYQVSISK